MKVIIFEKTGEYATVEENGRWITSSIPPQIFPDTSSLESIKDYFWKYNAVIVDTNGYKMVRVDLTILD